MMLPPERPGHDAPADLIAKRAGLAAAVASGVWRTDPAAEVIEIGGIRCLRFVPTGTARGTVLHIHGGAFRIGCPEMIAPFAAALSARCGVEVICPAYRLAPKHPFPAGLRDCLSVMTALSERDNGLLIVSGDSAGGGIAATLASLTTMKLVGLALLSPWLDLTVSSESYATNAASDPLFSAEAAREAAALYLQGQQAHDKLASPLLGPAIGFPPTFINVGAGEVLLDDARRFHEKLSGAGLTSQLEIVANMDHVAVTRDLTLPGAAQSFESLAAFINSALAQGKGQS
jgi:epsilon-lactone hydrolase